MKKGAQFNCDQSCQKTLDNIKKYLSNPPILRAPVLGKPLVLYIAYQEKSLAALCTQENEESKEKALYYLTHTLVRA